MEAKIANIINVMNNCMGNMKKAMWDLNFYMRNSWTF